MINEVYKLSKNSDQIISIQAIWLFEIANYFDFYEFILNLDADLCYIKL